MKFGNEKKFLFKASGYLSLQRSHTFLKLNIICYYLLVALREEFCFICLFKVGRLDVFSYRLRGRHSGEEMENMKG